MTDYGVRLTAEFLRCAGRRIIDVRPGPLTGSDEGPHELTREERLAPVPDWTPDAHLHNVLRVVREEREAESAGDTARLYDEIDRAFLAALTRDGRFSTRIMNAYICATGHTPPEPEEPGE